MPVPVGGPNQHYAVVPEDYFARHELQEKGGSASWMLDSARAITGGKGRLLDIGAGRGELLRVAREQGWEAIGIEPSSTFADYAAHYSGAEIRSRPIEDCSFEPDSFDVVIMAGVLEHLYNPDQTIREVSRVLRPGGTLFVDVPNEEGLYFRLGNLYYKVMGRNWTVNLAPTFAPFHVFGFGRKSLSALLAKHGLEVRTLRFYGGESYVPGNDGLVGYTERQAAKLVTAISRFGSLGTYIEAWAVRVK